MLFNQILLTISGYFSNESGLCKALLRLWISLGNRIQTFEEAEIVAILFL